MYLPRFSPQANQPVVVAADVAGDLVRWAPSAKVLTPLYTRIYGTVSGLSFRSDGKAVLVADDKLAR
jgi:hypothetical protein